MSERVRKSRVCEGEREATHDLVHAEDDERRAAERGKEGGEARREERRAVPDGEVVRREAALAEEEVLHRGARGGVSLSADTTGMRKGAHLDEQDGDKDRGPVTQEAEEVAERSGKVCRGGDGDGEVDGRADDGQEETRQAGEEGKDDLHR